MLRESGLDTFVGSCTVRCTARSSRQALCRYTLINTNLYSVLISDRNLLLAIITGFSALALLHAGGGDCAHGATFPPFYDLAPSIILALGLYEGLFYVKAIRSGVREVILPASLPLFRS